MFLIQTTLLGKLKEWDQWLFIQINNNQSNSFFDTIMPFMRSAWSWAPLYLFLLVFVTMNFRRGWWWFVLFLCTVSLCDMTSSKLVKEVFERVRPCGDADFFLHVNLLVDRCSPTYSFTSSHAANHFGMAMFIFITLRPVIKRWLWIAFVWASAVGYAQVYVGVHYPFDILGGAALGFFFGWLLGRFFNKQFGIVNFDE